MNKKVIQRLNQIRNSKIYVEINYKTRFTIGKLECKGLFFIEKYRSIKRLFKGVEILFANIRSEEHGMVLGYYETLEEIYDVLMGKVNQL